MKQVLSLLLILFIATSAMAQAPESVSYQAVIRNSEGKLVSEKPVGIRINILLQTEQGNAVYTETHLVNSNINGLVSLKIGTGTVVLGTFQKIDWGNGRYFLQTEIDPSGGSNYSIKNVSQVLSVPYALFAKTAGKVEGVWNVKGNNANNGDFLGTINEQPLEFKMNNSRIGYFDLKNNLFFGAIAGGSTTGEGNIAMGTRSLQFNTTGGENVAIGNFALHRSVSGTNNVAIGKSTLMNNNSGGNNVAVGAQSLSTNTTGSNNVALGAFALNGNDDGSSNTATGYFALSKNLKGNQNVATGTSSLYKNTLGNSNVANGYYSLYSNIGGSFNVATGEYALYSNISGEANTAIGSSSLYSNLTGTNNVAIGNQVLYKNNTGSYNVGSGTAALYENRKGKENVAYGYSSLGANIDGSRNAAFGNNALEKNNYGAWNVGIGAGSLATNTTGNLNTAVGYLADVGTGNLTNATAIGSEAIVNASNKVRIGNTSVTKIEGQVAFSFPSDARFKYNIKNNVPGLDFIKKLQPVTYYFDNEKLDEFTKTGIINNKNIYPVSYRGEKEIHTGFLAQDVEKTANELGYYFDGVRKPSNEKDHYSLAYSQFIMPLVKGMQEQQLMIEEQNATIEKQSKSIAQLQQLFEIEKMNQKKESILVLEKIKILEEKLKKWSEK